MLISDEIAKMIEEMLRQADCQLELRRNDLATRMGCVPSQINYVISSRFTPERGYMIESRRGGGGFIRITKVKMQQNEYLMHFFHAIGDRIDLKSSLGYLRVLFDNKAINEREANIIRLLLEKIDDDSKRADGMRQIILTLIK
ncbi:MAG: CtsR family transcriptional regulator [Clostridia bacterium]|nr:CtsR family transcriptional regulator [Clostridia bacterium]